VEGIEDSPAIAESLGGPVPDIVAPPAHHPRFPLSDGVRGLAAIGVLLVHVWLFTGGFGGFNGSLPNRAMVRLDGLVAIFFLLSGFLLYRPMVAHRSGGAAAPTAGSYARGRFLRVYPAYWLALTVLAIFPGLVGVFTDKWWVFYSLGDYFNPSFHRSVCPLDQQFRCGLPQSWTLIVEVTFYLALPFYAILSGRLARGRPTRSWLPRELGLLAILAGISVALTGGVTSARGDTWFEFTFAGHFLWLALGMALALVSSALGTDPVRYPRALRFAALRPSLCWLSALVLYGIGVWAYYPAPFPVAPFSGFEAWTLYLLQGAVAVLLLIPVLFGNPNVGAPAWVMRRPVVLWLGLISYGLYLWQVTPATDLGFGSAHEGFLVVLLGTLLFALPFAIASYYLVERPLMRRKDLPVAAWVRRLRRAAPESP
jgi:peptidoglycan/LPS O-acetylase OafA/YrhL